MKTKLLLFFLCLSLLSFSPDQPSDIKKLLKNEMVELSPGLHISQTEVSIGEYMEFMDWLIGTGKAELVPAYAPDPEVWLNDIAYNQPYATYYFAHPAFRKHPVLGITHEAAEAYCDFLSGKYTFIEVRTRNGELVTDTIQYLKFRLPTEAEWQTAAGLSPESQAINEEWYAGAYTYPRNHKGDFMFNHKLGKGDYAGYTGNKARDYEGYMITAPVKSFPKTAKGLYNIAGNVAEMVAEPGIAKGGSWAHEAKDCTIGSRLEYDEPMSWLGFRVVVEEVKGDD